MKCVVVVYCEDQNCPSKPEPELVELSNSLSRNQLRERVRDVFVGVFDHGTLEAGEELVRSDIKVSLPGDERYSDCYGDFQAERDGLHVLLTEVDFTPDKPVL